MKELQLNVDRESSYLELGDSSFLEEKRNERERERDVRICCWVKTCEWLNL